MEQLTEFVAKSFVDGKSMGDKLVSESAHSSLNATAHMVSNILSTIPVNHTATPTVHWPFPSSYPFPLFATTSDQASSFVHSKSFAINSMMERFNEMQHQLNQRSHSLHAAAAASMLYSTHRSTLLPLLVTERDTFAGYVHDELKRERETSKRLHESGE